MRTFLAFMAFAALSLTGCGLTSEAPIQPESWKTTDFQEVRMVAYETYSNEELVDVWVKGQSGDQLIAQVQPKVNKLDGNFGRALSFEIKRKDGSRRSFPPMVLGSVDKEAYRIGTVHLVDAQGKEFSYLSLLRVPK